MIQVIGLRRIITLFVLISINAALGAGVYLYVMPENERSERELRGLRAGLSGVQSDIRRMQVEFEQLDKQQNRFDKLKGDGFFSAQVRSDAKDLFSVIQTESKVISALASVKSGTVEDSVEAKKAGYKILTSLIEVEVKAFDDADIYSYIDIADMRFPGHLSIDSVVITRSRDVTSPVLRSIASGANPELVSAVINMSWRTMIPEDQVLQDNKGG
ncbi:MAG: hypothetical protein ACRBCK_08995 [Alphaproteobacteria bacterium]